MPLIDVPLGVVTAAGVDSAFIPHHFVASKLVTVNGITTGTFTVYNLGPAINGPVSIDYEMAEGIAGWQVYDVKVEGVSLVLNYRESFAGVVSAGGIDALIKALADKNRQVGKGPDAAALAPVLMIYSVGTKGPK